MRKTPPPELEHGRIRDGEYRSNVGDMHGAFYLTEPRGRVMLVISSGSDSTYGWEHVSVSLRNRAPNWPEMCFVKSMFWSDDECVLQYHPAKVDYVNYHPNCLHMWRPIAFAIPMPPSILVGPQGVSSIITPAVQETIDRVNAIREGA
jgi:hypothetical protein